MRRLCSSSEQHGGKEAKGEPSVRPLSLLTVSALPSYHRRTKEMMQPCLIHLHVISSVLSARKALTTGWPPSPSTGWPSACSSTSRIPRNELCSRNGAVQRKAWIRR